MNQILSTGGGMEEPRIPQEKKYSNNRGPAPINTVIMFFVICIVIFGVIVAGWAGYKAFINKSGYDLSATIPTIYLETIEEQLVEITVTHDKELALIEYRWNDEETTVVEQEGTGEYRVTIEVPSGANILNFTATDINGKESVLTQSFDISEVIKFKVENGDMLISVNSNIEIEAMSYKWNDEETVAFEVGTNTVEKLISIPKGLNNLTVKIVDINHKITEKEQLVEGIVKPKIVPSIDSSKTNIVLELSDEIGLKGLHISINGEKEYSATIEGALEYTYELPVADLYSGPNSIVVTVTNTKDISVENTITVNK